MSVLDEVLAANKSYVESFGDKGELPCHRLDRSQFLTCMDARLDPAKYAGLSEGDAHVIRNAGVARATTRSVLSSFPTSSSTKEWFVIQPQRLRHGVLHRRKYPRSYSRKSLETASLGPDGFFDVGKGPVPTKARLSTGSRSQTRQRAVVEGRSSAFVVTPGSSGIAIYGYVYDVRKWRARGGARGDESRRGEITRTIALAADWRPIAELRRWI